MSDERLRKIIETVIGNEDPYWNDPVYNIVKKIIDLPEGTESTISALFDNKDNLNDKFMFEINKYVTKVCDKINITLDKSEHKGANLDLPHNISFVKKITKKLTCPVCGEILSFMMPDGKVLSCNKCNKYYINNNGEVGDETSSPYTRKDALY